MRRTFLFMMVALAFCPCLAGTLANEAPNSGGRRVVVVPFVNSTGSARYNALSDGLAWLVGGDLAKVNGFAVVEREELDKVVTEHKLQATGLTGKKARAVLGKLLNAELIITGGFTLDNGNLRIDIRAVDVGTAKIVAAASATGPKAKLLDTEKKAINALVKKIEASESDAKELTVDDTPEVTLHYIRGLGHYFENQYEAAIAEFMMLAQKDEASELARYWIARSYYELKDRDHCVIECRKYLRAFVKGKHANQVRWMLSSCRKQGTN
jgi:TolB-like protein